MTTFQEMSENVEKKRCDNAQKEEDYEDAPDEFKGQWNPPSLWCDIYVYIYMYVFILNV